MGNCKGSFGGCQGQPLARPWHLLISSFGLTALPPLLVCLLYLGYCLYSLPYCPLSLTPYVIHARLACSLLYILAICFTEAALKFLYTYIISTIFCNYINYTFKGNTVYNIFILLKQAVA